MSEQTITLAARVGDDGKTLELGEVLFNGSRSGLPPGWLTLQPGAFVRVEISGMDGALPAVACEAAPVVPASAPVAKNAVRGRPSLEVSVWFPCDACGDEVFLVARSAKRPPLRFAGVRCRGCGATYTIEVQPLDEDGGKT